VTASELRALLGTLTPSQMRAILTCFWTFDDVTFAKAVKAAGAEPPIVAGVREGLAAAERGETVDLGSFAQYADTCLSCGATTDLDLVHEPAHTGIAARDVWYCHRPGPCGDRRHAHSCATSTQAAS